MKWNVEWMTLIAKKKINEIVWFLFSIFELFKWLSWLFVQKNVQVIILMWAWFYVYVPANFSVWYRMSFFNGNHLFRCEANEKNSESYWCPSYYLLNILAILVTSDVPELNLAMNRGHLKWIRKCLSLFVVKLDVAHLCQIWFFVKVAWWAEKKTTKILKVNRKASCI